jgi:hypothetical protein
VVFSSGFIKPTAAENLFLEVVDLVNPLLKMSDLQQWFY